jgi:hypothetical protein
MLNAQKKIINIEINIPFFVFFKKFKPEKIFESAKDCNNLADGDANAN